ncbi:lamin tail domain-containing protein, partial [Myxococcota bacterium]|nr:lamin tail domain-containing protein [Myxococcota bacterium]
DDDGDVDCADADCVAATNCLPVEDCDDGIDNDGDLAIDCADSDCLGQQGAGGLCQATETACADEFDNDADGAVDCTDDDCAADAACLGPVELCATVGDEDGDSLPDCQDPECNNQTGPGGGTCQTTETSCADSYDNDGDGLTDCADSNCAAECITAGSLVITEFIRDPTVASDANGEWFEIYNTTAAAIDLRGLVIFSAPSQTHVITAANPVSIAAGAYMVLGSNADPGVNGGVTVGYAYGSSISFNNTSDDSVGIRTSGGTVIDQVLFPVATFPGVAGKATSLNPANSTAVDNDNAANWCNARVKYNDSDWGTPGVANPSCTVETDCTNDIDDDGNGQIDCADFACANAATCSSAAIPTAGSLIVSEIMVNPGIGTPDYQYEWIEIKNVSASAVELNGLTLCSDTPSVYCSSIHFGVSTPLAAGASALFMSDAALWTGFSGIKYSYGSDIRLDNTAEGVQIYHGTTLIDSVSYTAAWPIATAGSSIQFSTSATQDSTANDAVANWCLAINEYDAVNHLLGTPGLANGTCLVATEICNDGIDNDSDTIIDCADTDCLGQTGSLGEVCEATETTCDDGFDNDRDGTTDCADPNCAGLMGPGGVNCDAGTVEDCTTPEDDDGDTFVNCMDLDCAMHASCGWLPQLYLWESDADTAGTDVAEFIEVINMTGTTVDFATQKYFILMLNGNTTGETIYRTVQLTGTLADNAIFLAGNAGVVPAPTVTWPQETLQNGQDGVLLVRCDDCAAADLATGLDVGTTATFTVAGGTKTVTKIDGLAYDTNDPDDTDLMARVGATIQWNEGEVNSQTDSLRRISHTSWVNGTPTPGVSNLQ